VHARRQQPSIYISLVDCIAPTTREQAAETSIPVAGCQVRYETRFANHAVNATLDHHERIFARHAMRLCLLTDMSAASLDFESSVHKGSISKKYIFFRKRVFVFCKFYFLILATRSDNCISIFTPFESSLKLLSNCAFLNLLI